MRGGKLAVLPAQAQLQLEQAVPGHSAASWAFRYLQTLPNIAVTLSGMTTLAQLEDNLATYHTLQPLDATELSLLRGIADDMAGRVPCTACRYCMEECPQKLDIPKLISMYNEMKYEKSFTLPFTLNAMTAAERPEACLQCGACARMCPQGINIPEVMEKFSALL